MKVWGHSMHVMLYTTLPSCGLLVLGPWGALALVTASWRDRRWPGWLGRANDLDGLKQSTDVGVSPRVSWSHELFWSDCRQFYFCMNPLGYPFPWRSCNTSFSFRARLTPDTERVSNVHISILSTACLLEIQDGGSESTDTDLCGWPCDVQKCW